MSLFGRSATFLLHHLLEIPTIHLNNKRLVMTSSTLKVVLVLEYPTAAFL